MVTRFVLSLKKTHFCLLDSIQMSTNSNPRETIQFRQEPEWMSFSMHPSRQTEGEQYGGTDWCELTRVNNLDT
jgi:hypothetical protein